MKLKIQVQCPHCNKINESLLLNPKGPDNFGNSFEDQEIFATCMHCKTRYQYISPKVNSKEKIIVGYVNI